MEHARRTRRFWSDAEKRRIVAETYEDGVSVSEVARCHDVNANLVFTWRRDPRYNDTSPKVDFLPVEISAVSALSPMADADVPQHHDRLDGVSIESDPPALRGAELDLGGGMRLRFADAVPEASLVRLIAALLKQRHAA